MKRICYSLFSIVILLSSCNSKVPHHFTGRGIGTFYSITYTGEAYPNLQSEIDAIFDLITDEFSIFDTNSTVSKINKNQPVPLSNDFIKVFNQSMEVSRITDGAFDITVGALVNFWGFGVHKRDSTTVLKDSIKDLCHYEKVKMIDGIIEKENSAIQLDFNAIAKGFCVDKIAELLNQKGITDFLVEVGGEISAKGSKFGNPWKIGIQTPTTSNDGENNASYSFSITDKSIATSGNYRNYIEEGGRRFTHIIDPKSGYPEETNLLSVTVIADDCATADAFATAFMVMGIEKTEQLLQAHPELAAFFIYTDSTQMLTKKSVRFP